jgi:predicted ArsR family transcriptional regulator
MNTWGGRRDAILTALRTGGDWMERNQIAEATAKRRLSPNDVQHLNSLVVEGLVEQQTIEIGGRTFYRYRIGQPVK